MTTSDIPSVRREGKRDRHRGRGEGQGNMDAVRIFVIVLLCIRGGAMIASR
jgi:hypothetical protein